jgi:hypothetical protein
MTDSQGRTAPATNAAPTASASRSGEVSEAGVMPSSASACAASAPCVSSVGRCVTSRPPADLRHPSADRGYLCGRCAGSSVAWKHPTRGNSYPSCRHRIACTAEAVQATAPGGSLPEARLYRETGQSHRDGLGLIARAARVRPRSSSATAPSTKAPPTNAPAQSDSSSTVAPITAPTSGVT